MDCLRIALEESATSLHRIHIELILHAVTASAGSWFRGHAGIVTQRRRWRDWKAETVRLDNRLRCWREARRTQCPPPPPDGPNLPPTVARARGDLQVCAALLALLVLQF